MHTWLYPLDLYRFVFQFSREGTHKTLEKDSVLSLLPIILDKHRAPHLPLFLDFLSSSAHTRITMDQWESFLQFQDSVRVDLSGYEDDNACNTDILLCSQIFSVYAFMFAYLFYLYT